MASPPNAQAQPDPAAPTADLLLDTLPWGVLVVSEHHVIQRANLQAARWGGAAPADLLGQPLAEARLPAGLQAALARLLAPGADATAEVFLPGLEQWLALAATPQPGGWVVHGQDITPQKQREQHYQALADNTPAVLTRWGPDLRREAELEEHYRAQLAQQVAERTQQLRDSHDLLQSVLNAGLVAIAVMRAVRTATGTLDDFVFTLVNQEQERLSGRTDLVGKHYRQLYPGIQQTGIWENLLRVLATGQPQRAELYYPYEGFHRWFEYQFVQLGDGVVATTLDITGRKEAEAAAQRQRQQQLEAVLEGQEEERRRIAESLHNGIGQLLFATKLRLDQLPPRPHEPGWAEVRELLADAIRQTRAVSHELTPAVLADFGLQKALELICQQLYCPGLRWHCYIDLQEAPAAMPAVLQQAVYRLVQGLAHNVAKHAQASEATIEVTALPSWLMLHLEDNGRGFDPATVQAGLGLKTRYSRVALLGGVVQIDSAPGEGTRIQVRLPL